MNSFFVRELGKQLTETPFGSPAFEELSAQMDALAPDNERAVTDAAERIIYEKFGRRVSMARGHIAFRAQVQFAG